MRILLTGMCGFIGHHVADHLLEETDWELVGLDRVDATSTLHRLHYVRDWERKSKRCQFVWHDLRAPLNSIVDRQIGPVDVVLHLAASTHVDRSITEPLGFVLDNVVGSAHLLDWWRERKLNTDQLGNSDTGLFVQFGTDEVFGPAPEGVAYKEWDRYHSTNPYSATKAGATELACAFSNTYGLRIIGTFTMNVFGERQHPEKFIPGTIRKVLAGETVIVHANKERTQAGSRFYLHADNVGAALRHLIQGPPHAHPAPPLFDKWNLVGEREVSNLEMAQAIADILGKPLSYELVDFHSSRPGHDLRYALDGTKLRESGFTYPMSFQQSLERTVQWFVDHPEWLEP
jgi:dTDP-glucose 4,6-dehydratase